MSGYTGTRSVSHPSRGRRSRTSRRRQDRSSSNKRQGNRCSTRSARSARATFSRSRTKERRPNHNSSSSGSSSRRRTYYMPRVSAISVREQSSEEGRTYAPAPRHQLHLFMVAGGSQCPDGQRLLWQQRPCRPSHSAKQRQGDPPL